MLHGFNLNHSSTANDHDDDGGNQGSETGRPDNQQTRSDSPRPNQGSLLIYATSAPVDIRHSTVLSLLNEGRELSEMLIDALHAEDRSAFGQTPRTHRKQARLQFLALAEKKRPRINKICKVIKLQLAHLKHISPIYALAACGGSLLAAGRYVYQKLLVVSELVRQLNILYHSDSRSIPIRIVSLSQAHVSPIVRGKAKCNVEFRAKISISVACEGFTFLDRLTFDSYSEGEDLNA